MVLMLGVKRIGSGARTAQVCENGCPPLVIYSTCCKSECIFETKMEYKCAGSFQKMAPTQTKKTGGNQLRPLYVVPSVANHRHGTVGDNTLCGKHRWQLVAT